MNTLDPLFPESTGPAVDPVKADVCRDEKTSVPAAGPMRPFIQRYRWGIAGALLIPIFLLFFIAAGRNTSIQPSPPLVEIPLPSPTPVRTLSAIATDGAFIRMTQLHASLSSELIKANTDDPSLAPPVIALPLGFR